MDLSKYEKVLVIRKLSFTDAKCTKAEFNEIRDSDLVLERMDVSGTYRVLKDRYELNGRVYSPTEEERFLLEL